MPNTDLVLVSNPSQLEVLELLCSLGVEWSNVIAAIDSTDQYESAVELLVASGAIETRMRWSLANSETQERHEFVFRFTGFIDGDLDDFLARSLPLPTDWFIFTPNGAFPRVDCIIMQIDKEAVRLTRQGVKLKDKLQSSSDATEVIDWLRVNRHPATIGGLKENRTSNRSVLMGGSIAVAQAAATVGDITVAPVIHTNVTVAPDPSYATMAESIVELIKRTSPPAGNPASTGNPQEAVEVLYGWDEILDVLKRPNSDQERISRLNKETGGPIKIRKGAKPEVIKPNLIIWWNLQHEKADANQAVADAREASINGLSQVPYRTSEVVPEISGSVKKRAN